MVYLNIYSYNLIFFLLQELIILNFKNIALFFNFYDSPDMIRKKHTTKTPLLGGLIIYTALLFIFLCSFVDNSFAVINKLFFKDSITFFYFFISSTFMLLIGLVDDKNNLKHYIKLLLTTLVIIILIYLDKDILINTIDLSFYPTVIDISQISFFFTILCFLLFINAINMLDGIDGQVGLYSIFLFLFILSLVVINLFSILMIVSLCSFLYLNLIKKCFLGDGGTILLGFIFSYILIKLYNQGTIYFADNIFLIMLIPGLDMLRLFVERLVSKKNPFKGDNNHIHHLFLNKFGKQKAILYVQLLIIIPIILSFYFNLLLINFLTIIIYFLLVTILKKEI